jgi:hypothetical protein
LAVPAHGETTGGANLSDELSRSKGVIYPPAEIDPGIWVPLTGRGVIPMSEEAGGRAPRIAEWAERWPQDYAEAKSRAENSLEKIASAIDTIEQLRSKSSAGCGYSPELCSEQPWRQDPVARRFDRGSVVGEAVIS